LRSNTADTLSAKEELPIKSGGLDHNHPGYFDYNILSSLPRKPGTNQQETPHHIGQASRIPGVFLQTSTSCWCGLEDNVPRGTSQG
jgi:hypothetical protein